MRLVHRITLAILATLLLVVAIVAGSLYVSIERGFSWYVRNLEEARLEPAVRRLTALYAHDRSWQALAADPRRFGELLRGDEDREASAHGVPPAGKPPRDDPPPPRGDRPPPPKRQPPDFPQLPPAQDRPPPPGHAVALRDIDPLELPPRVTLYDAERRPVVGPGQLDSSASRLPLVVDGEIVGWLGVRAIDRFDDALDLHYLQQVRVQLAVIAAAALAIGLLAGWLLTRRILRPIDALSAGTRRLASGDYAARIGPGADDEIGRLGRDFDALAVTLGEAADARRQWVADTSHELRTPVTVLRAEVEAILDGVRPMDVTAMESLHTELVRLGKLVDDLSELARSDRGRLALTRVPMAPVEVLRGIVGAFQVRFAQRNISIELAAPPEDLRIAGDRLRLQQVFTNLMENSLRYTDEGGRVRISIAREDRWLALRFEDSSPAVPAEALPHIFERFYRADPSRSRAAGGSGLGLSICRHLIEAHDGTIAAAASQLGGVSIEINLPMLTVVHQPPSEMSPT